MDDINDEAAPDGETANEESGDVGRRDLIKKTVIGAGVAGLVWSAPRIEGLSVRPDYAAAASGGGDSDPSAPFDQFFPMTTLVTPGPYTEPGNPFPNLAFGYGWDATGGPGATDFSVSGSSDCAINVDAQLFIAAADVITDTPLQPGPPFPFTVFKRYSWGSAQVPNPQGIITFHFSC